MDIDLSCILLAGGKGLRLGRDKTSEAIGNKTLLQRVVSSLGLFNCDIIIVTAGEQSLFQSVDYSKLRMVADAYPGKGVLNGIYTGLTASDSHYNLVVACDMPFLNHALLHYMIQLSSGFDAVVPRLGNMVEPLHAIYSKDCLPPIQSLLEKDILSVLELFPLIEVRYLEAEEIERFDPKHLSFFNINTEADLNRARRLVKDCLTTLK